MAFDLTNFLIKKFKLSNEDVFNPETRSRYGYLEGIVSVIINFFIASIKVIMGIAIGSLSLIADAIHTASDVVTSLVVILGFKISKKPADKEHPFGHGRMEDIATLIIAVLLCVVGLEILKNSFIRFSNPPVIEGNIIILLVLSFTVLLKEWLARFSFRLGREIKSSILYADAWHHRSDAISTLFVIAAITGSMYKIFKLDAVFAGVVAGYIVYTGIRLIKDSSFHLLGKVADEQVHDKIIDIAKSVDGVQGVHDIVVHDYGMHQAISLHIEVVSSLDSAMAHTIATSVEAKIAQQLNSSPIVHIDLTRKKKRKISAELRILKTVMKSYPPIINYHGAEISSNESGDFLGLHIVVSKLMSVEQSHELSHQLQESLKPYFKNHKIDIHIEPCDSCCEACQQGCQLKP